MTDKQYTVAGTSRFAGGVKARFANELTRVKVLDKAGHTEINLVELPSAMLKTEAVEHLIAIDFHKGDAEVLAALEHVAGRSSKPATAAAAPAAAEEAASPVTLPVLEEEIPGFEIEATVDDKIIELPKKELSMTPDAIRKREARARKATERLVAWSAGTEDEDDAEEAESDDNEVAA
jgi:FAD/FMN-containing dehydrogenase